MSSNKTTEETKAVTRTRLSPPRLEPQRTQSTPAVDAFDRYSLDQLVTVYSVSLEDNGAPSNAKTVRGPLTFIETAPSYRLLMNRPSSPTLSLAVRTPPSSLYTLRASDQHRRGISSFQRRRSLHQLPSRRLRLCQDALSPDAVSLAREAKGDARTEGERELTVPSLGSLCSLPQNFSKPFEIDLPVRCLFRRRLSLWS